MSKRKSQVFMAIITALLFAVTTVSVPTTSVIADSSGNSGHNAMGAYVYDRNYDGLDDVGQWLNKTMVQAEDFFMKDNWSQVEGENRINVWANSPYKEKMSFAVPPFPQNSGCNMVEAANGAYNSHYRTIGQNLINAGMGNAILRFGHEFNGGWYHWSVFWSENQGGNGERGGSQNYAAAFRQFVDTLRALPGANFKFCWNPSLPSSADLTNAWPGDSYVDIVGVDIYDRCWLKDSSGNDSAYYPVPADLPTSEKEARWNKAWDSWLYNNDQGQQSLRWITQWAIDHGNKDIGICEWGVWDENADHGGGDNYIFIQRMHDYMKNTPSVKWHTYFFFGDCSHNLMDSVKYPKASAKFLELWKDVRNQNEPAPAPKPTVPNPSFPGGTKIIEAESGVYGSFPSGTWGGNFGEPWASGKVNASLHGAGTSLTYTNCPAAAGLNIRYQGWQSDMYASVYVNGVLKASHLYFPAKGRGFINTYGNVDVNVPVPVGATVKIQIDSGDDTGGWDSLRLDYIAFLGTGTGASGALVNGSFDDDGADTQNPTGWSTWSADGLNNADYVEAYTGSYDGTYHLAHWRDSAYQVTTYQNISSLENGTYTLTAYVKNGGGQKQSIMYAKNYGGNQISYNLPVTGSWTQITIPNINVTNNQCEIGFYSDAYAGNWINVDKVTFTKTAAAKYEAENGTISGASVVNDSSASNGKAVGNFGPGASISWTNVQGGTNVKVGYSVTGWNSQVSLYINGTHSADIYLPDTGSWSTFETASATVNVPEGATVKLQYDSGDNYANYDYIEISGESTQQSGNTHQGAWAAKASVAASASNKYLLQWPGLANNTTYTLSMWVKGTSGSKLTLQALKWNWQPYNSQTVTCDGSWQQVQLTFTTIEAGAGIRIINDAAGTSGTIYVDDCYLGIGTGGTNVLSNPSFESGSGWSNDDKGTVFTIVKP